MFNACIYIENSMLFLIINFALSKNEHFLKNLLCSHDLKPNSSRYIAFATSITLAYTNKY